MSPQQAADPTATNASAMTPPADPVMLPPSYVQELLWLMDRASPGSSAYNVPRARRLVGRLDLEALRRAFDTLAARHEILRTTYAFHGERPVQVIHAPRPVDLTVADLRTLAPEERRGAAERIVSELARRPFDLASEFPLRVTVLQLDDAEHVLHIGSHHIAFDGWSKDILFRELSELYVAFQEGREPALPPLPIQYADFAIWQREHLAGERLETLLAWWREHLAGASFVLELPTDFPRPAVPGFAGVSRSITLPAAVVAQVRELARQHDATMYMTLLAAIQTLLHRYSGAPDVLVGSPIAGRALPETEGLIGYFANTIVQRGRFADDPSFGELLARTREGALGAYDHQDVPFEKLVLELQGGQQFSHAPLFQVVFTMLGGSTGETARLGDLELHGFGGEDGATKFDLTFFMSERPDGLVLTLRARADLFAPRTVERMLAHLRRILDAAIADPAQRVSRIPLLDAEEKAELARWQGATVDEGTSSTIAALFEAQAARVPERVAIISGDRSLTYAELNARANQLAHRLRALGAGPDIPVGLALERSVDVIVGLLGVLKAGSAYVPLLPELPSARIARQIEESGARVVVTVSAHADRLPAGITTVCLDRDAASLCTEPGENPAPTATPDSLAYVLFTSGSTGVPKGVSITHRNIVHYTRAVSRVLADLPASQPGEGLASLDGWQFATVSTLGADLGNTSVFPSLCAGGTLHVLATDVTTDPARFAAYMRARPVDVVKITPNHLHALIGARSDAEIADVLPARWLVLGGEALSWELAGRLLSARRCRVLNHYGPTETTVGVCTFEVTRASAEEARACGAQTVPIGVPLANTTCDVLDAHGEPVPLGVPGELYIAGEGVARGYLHRAELTAERFVTRPNGARAYRTGDRVRRLATGAIEFLGRFDDQVKIRGHRVELGEIEHALAEHPGVEQCAVAVRQVDGEPRLAAYAVAKTSGYAAAHAERATPERLREWIAERLPEHMVPATVVLLDRLPLTANGKVNRAALPDPVAGTAAPEAECVAPRTETESVLAAIWAEVLKKERVGVTDNFIALGGHSLLAIRVLGKISRRFGVRLPLRTLFDAPTIESLAELVEMEVKLAMLETMSEDDAARLLDGDGASEPSRA